MVTVKSVTHWLHHQRWPVALLGLSVGVFLLAPRLDLRVAQWFYDGATFPLDRNVIVHWIYLIFAKIHLIFLVSLPIFALYEHTRRERKSGAAGRRSQYIFLWLTLLIGPGLITHIALKDNSFGRPRPRDVTEFAGTKHYAEPFEVSNECPRNCSFVSGHAAIGFWFLTLGWVYGRKRWLITGAILGITVGATRMVQGAHFLGDVVFAFWVVWFTNALIAPMFGFPGNPITAQIRRPPSTSKTRPEI